MREGGTRYTGSSLHPAEPPVAWHALPHRLSHSENHWLEGVGPSINFYPPHPALFLTLWSASTPSLYPLPFLPFSTSPVPPGPTHCLRASIACLPHLFFYLFSSPLSPLPSPLPVPVSPSVVRASVPRMDLDQVFEVKNEIARTVEEELEKVGAGQRNEAQHERGSHLTAP